MCRYSERNRRGGALIAALIAVAVIAAMTLGLSALTVSSNGAIVDTEDRLHALYLAESGVALGFCTLDIAVFAALPDGTVIVPAAGDPRAAIEDGVSVLAFGEQRSVRVVKTTNAAGFPALESTGTVQKKVIIGNITAVSRTLEAVVGNSNASGAFPGGAFGLHSLETGGNFYTDSYDSSKGPYGGANQGHDGNIGTNGALITKGGSFLVDGDANPGPGQPPLVNANVTGSGAPLDSPVQVSIPPYIVPPDASTVFSNLLTGGSILATNYHFPSLNTRNNDVLVIQGSVNIYVDGDIDLKGDLRLAGANSSVTIYQRSGTLTLNGGGQSNDAPPVSVPEQILSFPAGSALTVPVSRTVAASNSNQAPPAVNSGEQVPEPAYGRNGKVDYWTITTPAGTEVAQDTTVVIPAHTEPGNGVPSHFNIVTSTADAVKINGNSTFYGTLVAPNAPVTINGAAAKYGAVIGKDLKLTGTGDFHNDVSARSPGLRPLPVLLSCREK